MKLVSLLDYKNRNKCCVVVINLDYYHAIIIAVLFGGNQDERIYSRDEADYKGVYRS